MDLLVTCSRYLLISTQGVVDDLLHSTSAGHQAQTNRAFFFHLVWLIRGGGGDTLFLFELVPGFFFGILETRLDLELHVGIGWCLLEGLERAGTGTYLSFTVYSAKLI